MGDPTEKQAEKFLNALREESKKGHRELERRGGIATIVASLVMAVVFLAALNFTQNIAAMKYLSVFFLCLSVLLFARGMHDVVLGRKSKPGR
jgi:uncharacterized membrane protein